MSEAVPLSATGFQAATNVSRETLVRLESYVDLLRHWNERINLVSRDSLRDVWRRHLLDSAQLFAYLPNLTASAVDLGSGAGFPGLVLAIMGLSDLRLIEADQRKSAFLREAARVTETQVTVIAKRIEDVPATPTNLITARAFAPLPKLLDMAERFLGPNSLCLLLKGKGAPEELTEARKQWKMIATSYPSLTDPSGWVLRLEKPTRELPGRTSVDHA